MEKIINFDQDRRSDKEYLQEEKNFLKNEL